MVNYSLLLNYTTINIYHFHVYLYTSGYSTTPNEPNKNYDYK